MKKLILLFALPMVLGLFALNASASIAIQQGQQTSADDVDQLKKTNASLKSQLAKQRTLLMSQIRQNDSSISKLKAISSKQQSAISGLEASIKNQQAELSKQQDELNKVPEAVNQRSHVFGAKRTFAFLAVIAAFILVIIYVLSLRKKVDAFNENLKKAEDSLNQKVMQAGAELKDNLSRDITSMKAMLERQTTENKNRIIALLADANQMVHKMGDEVNKTTDVKIGALKSELAASVNAVNEKLSNLNQNKSF
jgi:predicted PurR-regulated permease PerM